MKRLYQIDRGTLVHLGILRVRDGGLRLPTLHDAVAKQTSRASHCSLCVVAHNAAVVTPANAALAPVATSSPLAISGPQLQSQLQVASSSIRPLRRASKSQLSLV